MHQHWAQKLTLPRDLDLSLIWKGIDPDGPDPNLNRPTKIYPNRIKTAWVIAVADRQANKQQLLELRQQIVAPRINENMSRLHLKRATLGGF